MHVILTTSDGNTPLTSDELAGLIPSLSTREELNEWERENILLAREWALADRGEPLELVTDDYIRKLHKKMFGETWTWAGVYRTTDKNIGVPWQQIREQLGVLLGDVRYWIEHQTYPADEIALRFHHRLVQIHPFPNGNGRHARLISDLLAIRLRRPQFSWGSKDLVRQGASRTEYLAAVRAADAGDIQPLLSFARS